jgi:glycosyltransferase involved in cell wall biosynthesis/SAM-dependent methyltransferase
MRVLVLAQYFAPDMGGGSTRATNVVKGLLSKGCEVTVVAAFPHYPHGRVPANYSHKAIVPERFETAKVYRVWIPSLPHSNVTNRVILHLCFVVSSLFALPFVGKTDVVWGANPNLFSFFSSFVYGVAKRVPIVRNVDDLWPEVFYELGYVKSRFARKVLDFVAWLSYVLPAAITPLSMGYKRSIVAKYGVSPEKVHVVEVGVDSVKPLSAYKNLKDQFTVMYSGVLGLGYDFDVVLKAARFLSKNEDVVFVIRGVGEMAPKLKKATERGLRNVVLDTRFLPKNELAALLGSADVFVLPMAGMSFVDLGLPTKVFEYQAYGKPIICVSGGEPARYVEATGSGLVVKPNDVGGFAEAVVKLYKDRKLAAELGWNGWRYVLENLTVELIGERIYEVLSLVEHNFYRGSTNFNREKLTIEYFETKEDTYGEQRALREPLRVHITNLSDSFNILDIGCGDGSLLNLLRQGGFSVGVDLCKALIKKGKSSHDEHIEYVIADAGHLPFKGKFFDVVTAVSVLHHVSEQGKKFNVIDEINRVLSLKGRFFLRELCPHGSILALSIQWLTQFRIARCFPPLQFLTKMGLTDLLKRRFSNVEILEQSRWSVYRFPMGNNVSLVAYNN